MFSVILGGEIEDNGEKEILPWSISIMGGDYALMGDPLSMSDSEGRQMRIAVPIVGYPKTLGHVAPDGYPLFAHNTSKKWKCCQTLGQFSPEQHRFSYIFGSSPYLGTFPGQPSSVLFRSPGFRKAGGSSWLTDDDPEQIIWDYTQYLCVLSGKDSVLREAVKRLHIDTNRY